MSAQQDLLVERAAKALEKSTMQTTYGWTDDQFEIWWNRDSDFIRKVHVWPSFTGTLKEKRLHDARIILEAAKTERQRYIDKCREMAGEFGEYTWWSRLAELLEER